MRWDDDKFEGQRGEWRWFVTRNPIENIDALAIHEHLNQRLWIATFDSGMITPTPEELLAGWKSNEQAMVSPPLYSGLAIPSDQYDEWYIFGNCRPGLDAIERFVNYGGFNLADPRAVTPSFDPTWEPSGLVWLSPIQDRFWAQLTRLAPISYIASGDRDVVVTRNPRFAERVRRAIHGS